MKIVCKLYSVLNAQPKNQILPWSPLLEAVEAGEELEGLLEAARNWLKSEPPIAESGVSDLNLFEIIPADTFGLVFSCTILFEAIFEG